MRHRGGEEGFLREAPRAILSLRAAVLRFLVGCPELLLKSLAEVGLLRAIAGVHFEDAEACRSLVVVL